MLQTKVVQRREAMSVLSMRESGLRTSAIRPGPEEDPLLMEPFVVVEVPGTCQDSDSILDKCAGWKDPTLSPVPSAKGAASIRPSTPPSLAWIVRTRVGESSEGPGTCTQDNDPRN
jgi:hypothetical protein